MFIIGLNYILKRCINFSGCEYLNFQYLSNLKMQPKTPSISPHQVESFVNTLACMIALKSYNNIQHAPKVVLLWLVWAKDNSAGLLRGLIPKHNTPAVWVVDSTNVEEAS